MIKTLVLSFTIILLFTSFLLAEPGEHPCNRIEGCVPDAATAVKIGEAVLIPLFGEEDINSEKPFKAVLKDGVWIVTGTLHCPGGEGYCLGGTAVIKISKDDGRILDVYHEQ